MRAISHSAPVGLRRRAWKLALTTLCIAGFPALALAQKSAKPAERPVERPAERTTAQKTNADDRKWSTVIGIVVDSVHGSTLSDATVLIDGTTLSATTDMEGKFRIDSIPPGDYRIAVFHPLLDTLGFSIGTPPLRMGADSVRQVLLGTPSQPTIVKGACSALKLRLGPGALTGRVLDPDTQAPLDSVRVTLVWSEMDIGKDIGVRRTQKLREAYTNSSGTFTICGIPAGTRGTLQAERGTLKTAEVPVDMGNQVLAMESLFLSRLVAADSGGSLVGTSIVSGRVVNSSGVPVSDARVSVQGARSSTVTGKDGEFQLGGLPSGTRAVLVRRVGYSPSETAVDLSSATPARVVVRLAQAGPTLEEVKVEGKYEAALKKNGFTDRKKMGFGKFIDAKEIARRQPQYFSSIFQTIPGFRVEQTSTGSTVRSTRGGNGSGSGGCVTIWIDGVQWRENQGGELDNMLQPNQVLALETYQSSTVPSEFQSGGNTSCAAIVIWTNRTVKQ